MEVEYNGVGQKIGNDEYISSPYQMVDRVNDSMLTRSAKNGAAAQ